MALEAVQHDFMTQRSGQEAKEGSSGCCLLLFRVVAVRALVYAWLVEGAWLCVL